MKEDEEEKEEDKADITPSPDWFSLKRVYEIAVALGGLVFATLTYIGFVYLWWAVIAVIQETMLLTLLIDLYAEVELAFATAILPASMLPYASWFMLGIPAAIFILPIVDALIRGYLTEGSSRLSQIFYFSSNAVLFWPFVAGAFGFSLSSIMLFSAVVGIYTADKEPLMTALLGQIDFPVPLVPQPKKDPSASPDDTATSEPSASLPEPSAPPESELESEPGAPILPGYNSSKKAPEPIVAAPEQNLSQSSLKPST